MPQQFWRVGILGAGFTRGYDILPGQSRPQLSKISLMPAIKMSYSARFLSSRASTLALPSFGKREVFPKSLYPESVSKLLYAARGPSVML